MTHAYAASAVEEAREPARREDTTRSRRRLPWAPAATGPYRLPRSVEGRLLADLTGYRNRDAAFALAVFLGRFWSSPNRIASAYPIDRRALAEHPQLGLTEGQVRGALRVLEEAGFIERQIPERGTRYQATEHGLHRRPILWRFGSEYGQAFAKANERAGKARGGVQASRLPTAPTEPSRPSSGFLSHFRAAGRNLPKDNLVGNVRMGNQRSTLSTIEPNPGLEAALERWKRAIGG